MRALYSVLALFLTVSIYSQGGSISSIEVIPPYPTTADSVYLVGHFQFTSGGCEKQFFLASVVGSNVIASAQHCTGMLAMICDISDTVNLGLLSAGSYAIDLALSSGAAPVPCTPGIVPDDNLSSTFVVTAPTDVVENAFEFGIVPNPVVDVLSFSGYGLNDHLGEQFVIYSCSGQIVKSEPLDARLTTDVSQLPSGIYFVKIGSSAIRKFLKLD
jgi:hypothetical protein